MKAFKRTYSIDGNWDWDASDVFDNSADLWVETMMLWNCEEFSNYLQDWCDNANIGDTFDDDDDIYVECIEYEDRTDRC